jgi:hypothetical protein
MVLPGCERSCVVVVYAGLRLPELPSLSKAHAQGQGHEHEEHVSFYKVL